MTRPKMVRLQILILVPIFFLPAIDVIVGPASKAWKQEAARADAASRELVKYLAASDEKLLNQFGQVLSALSRSPAVTREESDSCRSIFSDILKSQTAFVSISAANINGDVFCDSAGSYRGNVADKNYFREAVKGGRLVLGDPEPGNSTGGNSMTLAYPYAGESGQAKGVVFAALDPAVLLGFPGKSFPDSMVVLIADSKGVILARYPDVKEWAGRPMPEAPLIKTMLARKEGFVEEKDLDGVPRNFAFAALGEGAAGELHIAAGAAKKPFNWLSTDLLENAVVLLGILALYGFAAGWIAGRHIPQDEKEKTVKQ